jgi:hypothetical protein
MNRKQVVLLIAIVFILIFFSCIFHTFIQVNIIEPAAFVLWTLWRVLESVSQNVYWQLLIWGSIFLLFRFMPNKKVSQTAYHHREYSKELMGSLFWKNLIHEAQFSLDKRDSLQHELYNMLIDILATKEQSSREEVQERFTQQKYQFPVFVYQYFKTKEETWNLILNRQGLKWAGNLPKLFQTAWVQPYYKKNQQILTWMETLMESNDEEYIFK